METYKGSGVFTGIAIGRILYYHRNERRIRQYVVNDVKTELEIFREACFKTEEELDGLYREYAARTGSEAEAFLAQKKILNSKSFKKAIESIIQNEKVNAAYAVMTTRDEITSTFRNLEEEVIRDRIARIRLLSA